MKRLILRGLMLIGAILFILFVILPQGFEILAGREAMARNGNMQPVKWNATMISGADGAFDTVRLSGKFTSTSTAYTAANSGNFEIIMQGSANYYLHQWHKDLTHGFFYQELMLTNFYSARNIRVGPYGSGGGGGSGLSKNRVFPGKRLWKGEIFVGADKLDRVVMTGDKDFREAEEFSNLKQIRGFLIPDKIIHTNWNKQIFTYSVVNIEFAKESTPEFFFDIREKNFKKTFDLGEGLEKGIQASSPGVKTK